MGLHRIVLGTGKGKRVLENKIRASHPFFNIGALVPEMKTDIAWLVNDMSSTAAIVRIFSTFQFLMHERRSGT